MTAGAGSSGHRHAGALNDKAVEDIAVLADWGYWVAVGACTASAAAFFGLYWFLFSAAPPY